MEKLEAGDLGRHRNPPEQLNYRVREFFDNLDNHEGMLPDYGRRYRAADFDRDG